jgi:hypothetical protein
MALTPEQITAARNLANQVIKPGATAGHVTTEIHNPLVQAIIDLVEAHATDQEAHGAASLPAGASGSILYHDGTNWIQLLKGADGQLLGLVGGLPAYVTPNNRVFNLFIMGDGYCYPEYYDASGTLLLQMKLKNVVVIDQLTGKYAYLTAAGGVKEFALAINYNATFTIADFDSVATGGNILVSTGIQTIDAGEVVLISALVAASNGLHNISGMLNDLANQYQNGNRLFDDYTASGGTASVNAHRFSASQNRIRISSAADCVVSASLSAAKPAAGFIILKNTDTNSHTFTFAGAFEAKVVEIPASSEAILYFTYDGTTKFKVFVIAGDASGNDHAGLTNRNVYGAHNQNDLSIVRSQINPGGTAWDIDFASRAIIDITTTLSGNVTVSYANHANKKFLLATLNVTATSEITFPVDHYAHHQRWVAATRKLTLTPGKYQLKINYAASDAPANLYLIDVMGPYGDAPNIITRKYQTPAVAASVLTIDCDNHNEVFCTKTGGGAIVVGENISVAYSNTAFLKTIWLAIEVTGAARTITFPAAHKSSDTRWATLALTLDVGFYQLSIMNNGAYKSVTCSNEEV